MAEPYQLHLKGANDLVTTYEATRAGFISLALEKNRQSTPSIEEARTLHASASKATFPSDLAQMPELEAALLTAAGMSDKAIPHLQPENKHEAVQGLITNFLEPAGSDFVDELVYRFLLIRGDSMGGTLRNVVGILAHRKFTRAILSALNLAGNRYHWLDKKSRTWIAGTGTDVDIEPYVRAISWSKGSRARVMFYNTKVPLVNKNIDICILTAKPDDAQEARKFPNAYLALGELKGGIDPAGADEHWKTANGALFRIRSAFSAAGCFPGTFFVGAAVVANMSKEIWNQLESKQLTNAANLTDPDQLTHLSTWVVSM